MTSRVHLQIDSWSDIICPWCYVGEARLARAIAELEAEAEVDVTVVPHAFELDPNHEHPEPVLTMLARKFGSDEAGARATDAKVAELAQAEGLPYTSDRMTVNTFDAHRLIAAARAEGQGSEVQRAIQRGYFSGDVDLSNAAALVDVVHSAGFDAERARGVLSSDLYADEVRVDQGTARQIGVTGVPFTVLDERLAIPGCVSTEQYASALRQALATDTPS